MKLNALLISNSTMGQGPHAGQYLGHCLPELQNFLVTHDIKSVLFIPYAGVTTSWDAYEEKVAKVFNELGVKLKSIHHYDFSKEEDEQAIQNADAIVVGGGNTFNLVHQMYDTVIMGAIAEAVENGKPLIGWSAGANIACPTLKTTNDMPIVEPQSFNCLCVIPFQINPHYLDKNPDGHGGETREARLEEFIEANPNVYVAGLREGCMFEFRNGDMKYIGEHTCRIFKKEMEPKELKDEKELQLLLA